MALFNIVTRRNGFWKGRPQLDRLKRDGPLPFPFPSYPRPVGVVERVGGGGLTKCIENKEYCEYISANELHDGFSTAEL